jgi:hypothetical protein
MMRSYVRAVGVQLVLVGIVSVVGVSTPSSSEPVQTGRSSAPAQTGRSSAPVQTSPFVGTWVLNIPKSTYEGIPPEQRRTQSTRTIDVEANGVFVETHRNITGGGRQGFYHWVGKPDGPEITEFGRTSGTAPGNRLTIKSVNDHQWAVTFRNQQGQVVLTDTWTVSPDGKTLTIDRHGTPPQGPPNHSVEVFDNEGWAMPRSGR